MDFTTVELKLDVVDSHSQHRLQMPTDHVRSHEPLDDVIF